MTNASLQPPPYSHVTTSTDSIQVEIIANTFSKEKPSLFQQILDSFNRSLPSDNIPVDMNRSEQKEISNDNIEKGQNGFHKTLKNRHLQMIAIGGAIGTGLFVGSGTALATGGPGALVLDFIIIGFMLFNVCMALGELCVVFPVSGSFTIHSARFLDPAWAFTMGWNYPLHNLLIVPLELTAVGIVISYWTTSVNIAVWITIFLIGFIIINLFGVRGYGEIEFLMSLVKVIDVIGFIVLGIVLTVGGGPNHQFLGGKYWHNASSFVNGFKGVCSVFFAAAFAFGGTELIGLAAAETDNPRKTIPQATKQVFWRITIFYVVSMALIGCLVPYTNPRLLTRSSNYDASASPFVIAIEDADIKVLPSIFNPVILCAVLSGGNSSVYGASRTLCALAELGQAPKIFNYIDRKGRPLPAVALSVLIGLIAYISYAKVGIQAFEWLLALSSLSNLFTWALYAHVTLCFDWHGKHKVTLWMNSPLRHLLVYWEAVLDLYSMFYVLLLKSI